MTVKQPESKKKKKGYRYDAEKNTWICNRWLVDVRVWEGKGKETRHRSWHDTKKEADDTETSLKIKSREKRLGVYKEPETKHCAVTVKQIFERYRKTLNDAEKARAENVGNIFLSIFADDLSPLELETAHWQLFINERLKTVSAETVSRDSVPLVAALKQASKMFPIELAGYKPPEFPRPKLKKRNSESRHVITEREKDGIIKAILNQREKLEQAVRTQSRPVIALMFELAWMLGLRLGEVRKLVKSDYNRESYSLRAIRWKTGGVTIFEDLPKQVTEIIEKAMRTSETELIFSLPCSRATFYEIIEKACEANGLIYGRGKIGGVTFHSTRHAFTTRLVQVTDPTTAQAFTGHSDKTMIMYYSHATPESKRRAMTALYGDKRDEKSKLQEIFDKVISGKMALDEFINSVKIA